MQDFPTWLWMSSLPLCSLCRLPYRVYLKRDSRIKPTDSLSERFAVGTWQEVAYQSSGGLLFGKLQRKVKQILRAICS